MMPEDQAVPFPFENPVVKPHWKRLMAFDFGTHRIGVATGQVITCTAEPLLPLKARTGQPDWSAVRALFTQWQPDAIVVGMPLNMDGSLQEISLKAKKFAQGVHGRFGLPVLLQDERLTTVAARAEVFDREGYQGLHQRSIDSLAACLILESWFQQTIR